MKQIVLNHLELTIFEAAAFGTFVLLIVRCIAKEVESTALLCIQTWKRLSRNLRRENRK
jgi:hypothetical protein